MDQRVGKVDSAGTFSYTRQDDAIDSDVLSDGAAVYRRGTDMFGETRGTTKNYYQSDRVGSNRVLVSSAGAITATREFDAFGNAWTPGTTGTFSSPFGFAGQFGYQTDNDSGLMLLGHRYYDSSTGRFISRDPILAGDNWYIYCSNDPVNSIDPEGLDDTTPPDPRRPPETTFVDGLSVSTDDRDRTIITIRPLKPSNGQKPSGNNKLTLVVENLDVSSITYGDKFRRRAWGPFAFDFNLNGKLDFDKRPSLRYNPFISLAPIRVSRIDGADLNLTIDAKIYKDRGIFGGVSIGLYKPL